MARYLDPKNDLVFKKVFGHHPDLLKSFLNAILPLPQDCVIEEIVYLTPESVPELESFKNSIVDVRCLDNHGRHFIVEMQLQWTKDFTKRMLFNTAATYVRQLGKGKKYQHLAPVYGLALIDDSFTNGPEWFHHYRMANVQDHQESLEDIQLVLIELPKLKPNTIVEKRVAILWLRFLKEINEKTINVDPSLLEVEEIKRALHLLEIASYNEAELLAYDQMWDAVSSERTLISGKFAEGIAKGKAEGLEEGLAKGAAITMRSMYQSGLSLEQIGKILNLSPQQVQKMIGPKENERGIF